MGQAAMAPASGVVNRAVQGFKGLNENGPGILYYGINAADQGLGYRGSYMTLGGFVPGFEDDLGGFWAADLRGHLSTYGGFFSNMGAVRKQFLGGSLLGVGVYWDYDGDLDQYSNTVITDGSGSYTFDGGQVYNQVGVSLEWLTDWGGMRSNGYMPVGTTAQIMGPFVGNSLLCGPGINAGLQGGDGEIGAYIPGLSDWAGMISVGGYGYGNTRYTLANGSAAVPMFGGVYTRLDMTFLENWDFSLQYNNDSYFDSTGFARLTYRMGGSRRRNVPDQMEQPMMRNEHIVRAHQAPEQAINPATDAPWNVIHVDNSGSVAAGGNGTAESPYRTLTDAQTAATAEYDIVFVSRGAGLSSPYVAPAGGWTFNADNQFLVGQGSQLRVPTTGCGLVQIDPSPIGASYPVVTAGPGDPAIVLTDAAGATSGATVNHLQIVGATVGISDGPGLPAGGVARVSDVRILGTGAGQRGVEIRDFGGNDATFFFDAMRLEGLTNDGFSISGLLGGNPNVNISNSQIVDTDGSAIVVESINDSGRVRVATTSISGASEAGVFVANANAIIVSSSISKTGLAGVYVRDSDPSDTSPTGLAGTSNVQVTDSAFNRLSVGIWATANSGTTNITITDNTIATNATPNGANGVVLSVDSGTSAAINTSIMGNDFNRLLSTVIGGTITSGTLSSYQYNPMVGSSIGNIVLTTTGTVVTSGSISVLTPAGTMRVKATDLLQLQSMNNGAGVTTVPLPLTNTTSPPQIAIPQPPVYNPALQVPLPPP
jgi:hypothetical protein